MTDTHKNAIIRFFRVSKIYGKNAALDNVSLDIDPNTFMYVTGPSGAGKSTLLKLIFLGEMVSDGHIIVDGMNLSRIDRKRFPMLRRRVGVIFQDFKLIPNKTVYDNVALVLEAAGEPGKDIPKKVNNVLKIAKIDHKSGAYPPSLSGGEQQRVAVARAIVGSPPIILADEPTGSLDAQSAEIIMTLLKEYHRRGATVIIATHNRDIIANHPGRTIFIKDGKLQTLEQPATLL